MNLEIHSIKRKSAVPVGRALVAGSADRPYPLERLGEVPYPDSPRQADASYSEKGHGHRPRQENAHPWQRLESRGHAQNQGTCDEERDQDCHNHDQLHRNRQGDRFHLNLLSWLAPLSSCEDHDDNRDALEYADEHRPEHRCTAHSNPLEDYRRLNRGEDDPHGEGNPLDTRSGESRPHLRRQRHGIHEDQTGNHRFEELALQETLESSVQNINRAHRGLLYFRFGMCNQATMAQLFSRYISIINSCSQGQKSAHLRLLVPEFLGLKNFLPPKLKYGSSRCFSPGSFTVLSDAAPRLRRDFGGQAPPFRIFAGGFPRPRPRSGRNAFGLSLEYCTT